MMDCSLAQYSLFFFFIPSLSMTSHPAPSLCGTAKDKAELFRERYTILQQVITTFITK